jgi:hypothetical protein
MSTDNALSFVGQIKTEHKAVLKADGEALKHAIECGKFLNLAKENVLSTKPKGKWTKWREENIPEISQQTASLYMRLAENEEAVAECTSIREADVALRKPRDDDADDESDNSDSDETNTEQVTDKEADETNNVLLVRSPDLKTTLQNVAVDEVCTALTQAWDAAQLRDLMTRVNAYLMSLGPPTTTRRPYPQPTLS